MREKYRINGNAYHRRKWKFKKILTTHKIRWAGIPGKFIWTGRTGSVTAIYDRDEVRDILVSCDLYIDSEDESFWKDINKYLKEVKAKNLPWDLEKEDQDGDMMEREIFFYIATHLPNIRDMVIRGAPELFVRYDVKNFLRDFKKEFNKPFDENIKNEGMLVYECPKCRHSFGNVREVCIKVYDPNYDDDKRGLYCEKCKEVVSFEKSARWKKI